MSFSWYEYRPIHPYSNTFPTIKQQILNLVAVCEVLL